MSALGLRDLAQAINHEHEASHQAARTAIEVFGAIGGIWVRLEGDAP
jgi:hypothetical protein